MVRPTGNWRGLLGRLVHSWYLPAALAAGLLIYSVVWLMPRKIDSVQSVDGRQSWDASEAPPRREVVWDPARVLLEPEEEGPVAHATPRLTDAGATLYFTRRDPRRGADIYRSRFLDGAWQTPEPVAELNSPSDDLGPIPSKDGTRLYLFSNRPGGHGGFDLYASRRTPRGWGKPQNLGPGINTPAHEYDPAIDPDGTTLVFASNRTAQMNAADPQPAEGKQDPWPATLRAHPGLSQFDLYLARFDASTSQWSRPEPILALNQPGSNEGAPSFSPSGDFLYFASDRPHRQGEPANLDIYRAKHATGQFTSVENLGQTVNTKNHETEPALSPEGYRLVFSSNRGGVDRLYESVAREVVTRSDWDTSHWSVLPGIWWKAVFPALIFMALLLILWYYNDWLLEKATLARFALASVLFHCFLLWLFWVTPLPEVLKSLVQGDDRSPAAEETLADTRHMGGSAGRQSFEKVADLQPVESVAEPTVERASLAAPDFNEPVRRLSPSLPSPRGRAVPLEEMIFEPAPPTPIRRTEPDFQRKPTSATRVAELESVTRPLKAEASPQPSPLVKVVPTLNRQPLMDDAPKLEQPKSPVETPRPESKAQGLPELADPEIPPVAAALPFPVKGRASELPDQSAAVRADGTKAPGLVGVKVPEAIDPEASKPVVDRRPVPAPDLDSLDLTRGISSDLPRPASRGSSVPVDQPQNDNPNPTPLADPLVRQARTPPPVATALNGAELPSAIRSNELGDIPGANPLVKRTPDDLPREAIPTPGLPKPHPFDGRSVVLLPDADPLPAEPLGTKEEPFLKRRTPGVVQAAAADEVVDFDKLFSLRTPETRKAFAMASEENRKAEEAVERGLAWLAAHQCGDGSWSLNQFHKECKHPDCSGRGGIHSDSAGTALALLPFLGAGYTHRQGPYRQTVERGLEWLIQHQNSRGGLIAKGDTQEMYTHGLAALALCEAYGMTRDTRLREPAQKCIDFIVKAQNPKLGGWRYTPGSKDCDTSVVGWQVMALKSGELAGLSIPAGTFNSVQDWLKRVEHKQRGRFAYQPGRGPTPAMTAQALLCLQYLGEPMESPRLRDGIAYLKEHPPSKKSETSYGLYLGTQAVYHMQGPDWANWNRETRERALSAQEKDGPKAGSWGPKDQWERSGGRIYSTSLHLLMLETPYRHLPLSRIAR